MLRISKFSFVKFRLLLGKARVQYIQSYLGMPLQDTGKQDFKYRLTTSKSPQKLENC